MAKMLFAVTNNPQFTLLQMAKMLFAVMIGFKYTFAVASKRMNDSNFRRRKNDR
jgi:hypothetical protein